MNEDDWRAWFGKLAIAFAVGGATVLCGESIASAQIIPDETLGAESSVVTPDNIKGLESDRISGGAVRGNNLFHSFREFNIGALLVLIKQREMVAILRSIPHLSSVFHLKIMILLLMLPLATVVGLKLLLKEFLALRNVTMKLL